MDTKLSPYKDLLRCKPQKATVRLVTREGGLFTTVKIPSALWPLSGPCEAFHCDNCVPISDEEIIRIVDAVPYKIGKCYSNAEAVAKALRVAGYDAKTYVGWWFLNSREYPTHHAWVVLERSSVIDISDNIDLMEGNAHVFARATTPEEFMRMNVEFITWATSHPHSKRCAPLGVPSRSALYIGCECSPEQGVQISQNLRATCPNHPGFNPVNGDGLTETQQLMKANNLID
jgi:hypothetical protein